MTPNLLSVSTLNAPRVIGGADSASVSKGRSYYYQGRVRIETVKPQGAQLTVRGTRSSPYEIGVEVEPEGATLSCDCPLAEGSPKVICKHKVAAALALQDHLRYHPIVTWETLLDKAIQDAPRRSAPSAQSVLLFSLQKRNSNWGVYLYSLASNLFTEESLVSPDTISEQIKRQRLAPQVKVVRSQVDPRRFVNVTDEAKIASHLSLLAQSFYFYNYDRTSGLAPILPLLSHSPLFFGTETNPLRKPLEIVEERGGLEIEIEEAPEGVKLFPIVTVGGEVSRLHADENKIVTTDPLWLIAGSRLMRLEGGLEGVQLFLDHPEIIVPREQESEFLERYLPQLAERLPVRGDALQWEDLKADPIPRLYLSEGDEGLRADLKFGYGDYELPFDPRYSAAGIQRQPDSRTLVRIHRQPHREEEAWRELSGNGLKRGHEPGEFLLRARIEPVDFLLHHAPKLTEKGYEIYGEQELTSAKVNRNTPSLSLNVSSGIDWFDVQAVVNFGEIEVSLKDIRRVLRKKERYIKLADGSIGEIPEEWVEKYRHLFAFGEETDEGLRLGNHHITLLDQLLADADRAQTDPEFVRRREKLQNFKEIATHDLPKGFHGELRPYQKAGYDWLHFLHEYDFGGCLADDMGIGKTVQALTFLLSLRERGEAKTADLIVLPRSLIFNWEREANRFTPDLRILLYADANRPKEPANFDNYDLVLTTYGIMLRDVEMLRQYQFHYVILDESQAIKNPLSQSAKAARLLRADHRLVLTGTPVENSTMELWSQFAFLNPGLLGNIDYFREHFGNAIEKRQDESSAQFLRKMVYPFILRRTKDQVAPELPPRTERLLISEMEPAQRKLYNRTRDYYRALLLGLIEEEGMNNARMKILEGLLRLRQICNHPRLVETGFKGESSKFEQLLETLETLQAEGHKALIFSQFVQMLKIVREALDQRGVPYVYLDGQTKDRQERVDTFQNSPEIPFFLISLKAGGVGLNLTAADYVIHIDPWWNPAVEMQATDRTHRIGQDKPVFVYKLIAKDSVEEKILQLQDRKRELVSQLITTEGSFFKSLTSDDVKNLFE